jgi:hypothetical protein
LIGAENARIERIRPKERKPPFLEAKSTFFVKFFNFFEKFSRFLKKLVQKMNEYVFFSILNLEILFKNGQN